jgi:hypothetical protein
MGYSIYGDIDNYFTRPYIIQFEGQQASEGIAFAFSGSTYSLLNDPLLLIPKNTIDTNLVRRAKKITILLSVNSVDAFIEFSLSMGGVVVFAWQLQTVGTYTLELLMTHSKTFVFFKSDNILSYENVGFNTAARVRTETINSGAPFNSDSIDIDYIDFDGAGELEFQHAIIEPIDLYGTWI